MSSPDARSSFERQPWRETQAAALDTQIAVLDHWLEATTDLLELLEAVGQQQHAGELRSAAAAIRSLENELADLQLRLMPDGFGRPIVEAPA